MGVVLGEVHFEVSTLEQRLRGFAILRIDSHADAGAGAHLRSENVGGLLNSIGQAAHDRGGLTVGGYIFEDNDKLAAEACNGFAAAGNRAQTLSDYEQQLISGSVTQGVVDLFEFVEIEVQDGHGAMAAMRPLQCLF